MPEYDYDEDDYEDDEEEEHLELLGAIMDEDPILGQRRLRRLMRRPKRRRVRTVRRARAALKKALVPATPGVPKPGKRGQPLGFTPVQFTNTSALILELEADPDRPFQGERILIEAVRSVAGSGGLLTVRRIDIGGKNQLVSREPAILGSFAADATFVELELDPVTPGVTCVIEVQASAQPGVGETVDIGATMFGKSIG